MSSFLLNYLTMGAYLYKEQWNHIPNVPTSGDLLGLSNRAEQAQMS